MLAEAGVRYVVVHVDDYVSDAARAQAVLADRPDMRELAVDGSDRLYDVVLPRRLTKIAPPTSESPMMSAVPISDSATAGALSNPNRRKK